MNLLSRAAAGERLEREELLQLYRLPLPEVASVAHELRLKRSNPRVVTYLIDRNINYTNICTVACNFCAFYRTRRQADAYVLSFEEIGRKIEELMRIGGRRILMQGGVNPDLPFEWYLELLRYLKTHYPEVRIDAFSPEEILGLEKLTGRDCEELLTELKEAGLDGLPGAGGEILVDEVRAKAAPARIKSRDWFRILDTAQRLGLYTIATMVIGFGETYEQRVEHLLQIRAQQDKALREYGQGFAAFAMWTLQTEHTRLKGKAPGATAHEYLRQLAIARIALDNIPNLQASWPTLGFKVAQVALYYGANDFGSTMLEENVVSVAAGHNRTHATVRQIVRHIADAGFTPAERDPYYNILRYPDVEAVLAEKPPTPLPLA
ncbi:MAG: dehypoxanthine futalosine cyclase [Meiothermus sp.]|uniref:cyclic dehypoxanthinyl futalosine synthase n=1 Tax=Meiothermus sp. TaxID=1955249 RepID=UPI0025F76585|nr:cyclic dehypoxanthinyl futalosine synthase [Meiothermus sp.]MCS7194929.1 dehypoxanthine futalosine cyclase [Meiothermus sp.]MCX7739949.1 dehypoxanthine futalosine cyclase [Meiothermus sp.]MDW8090856.1 cyclic dehypoxanthinyl futalosine synthase [Meiothermus sp.]